MITIDGTSYDVGVISLKRKAEFLDKYAERVASGELKRELIGVYFNYQLTITSDFTMSEYTNFWEKITEPKEFHSVTVPNESGTYTFKAYFSNIADEMIRTESGTNYFDNLTINFIAQVPARVPQS